MKNTLDEKHRIEREYHNEKYKNDIVLSNSRGKSRAYGFFQDLIGDARELRILDFGCGTGWMSIALAKSAAEVHGIDISEELIKKARQLADREGLSNRVCFQEMPAEDLTFPDDCFDLIFGSAILHHTDLQMAMKNISRVLKSNGRAIFIEPMNQNIVLRIWRKITPWRRSPAERALTEHDLKLILATFPEATFDFFTFFSIFTVGLLVISPANRVLLFLNDLMERLDARLLKLFPSLGKYSAVVVMELRKESVSL